MVKSIIILLIILGVQSIQASNNIDPFPYDLDCPDNSYLLNFAQASFYKSIPFFCSYGGTINNQFFMYFQNPYQESLLPNDPVTLVWINNIGESFFSPLFLEVGPFQVINNQIYNRNDSFLNYMSLLFIEAPSVGLSTAANPEGNLETLAKQYQATFDKICKALNLNGTFSFYGRQFGAIIATQLKFAYSYSNYTLILDNPIVDMITQQTSIGPAGLGIGLYSPEQNNIVQTKIANCITAGLAGSKNQADVCAQIGKYFELETQLDSHDTRQQLVGPPGSPSFHQQQTALEQFFHINSIEISSLLNIPNNKILGYSIFSQTTWSYFQQQFQQSSNQIIQLIRTIQFTDGLSIISSEFNMQEPALGASKLVSEILNIQQNYRKFPEKNVYKAGSLARQVNGLTAGFFYQLQNLSFIQLSRGLYLNNPLELNATSELVYNLALNNSKLCYQGICQNNYGRCEAMNKCNGNGACNSQGYCVCNWGFALEDCSLAVQPLINQTKPINLRPREWVIFQYNITQFQYQYLTLSSFTPQGQSEIYVSYQSATIDTFENYAGPTYASIYTPLEGDRILTFSQNAQAYISIRNPSFSSNFTFSLSQYKGDVVEPISYNSDALTIPSYVMFGVGGAAILIGLYLYIAKIK